MLPFDLCKCVCIKGVLVNAVCANAFRKMGFVQMGFRQMGWRPRRPDTVDSFVPESGDFDSFLAEEGREGARGQERSVQEGESSEEEGGNPMVARLDDSVEVESYAAANGSHVTAAQEDSSEDEQGGNPMVTRPKDSSEDEAAQEGAQMVENNLDDFLDS
jgi:hypothetical protein